MGNLHLGWELIRQGKPDVRDMYVGSMHLRIKAAD